MEEMAENQSLTVFKSKIDKALESQSEFENLKKLEQQLNIDITNINEELKKQQDDFAKEA